MCVCVSGGGAISAAARRGTIGFAAPTETAGGGQPTAAHTHTTHTAGAHTHSGHAEQVHTHTHTHTRAEKSHQTN